MHFCAAAIATTTRSSYGAMAHPSELLGCSSCTGGAHPDVVLSPDLCSILLSLCLGPNSSWESAALQGFCRLLQMEGHEPLPGSLDDLSPVPQVFQNAQMIPLIWHPVCAALYIATSIGTCHIQSISCAQMHLSFLLLLVLCHQQRKVKLIFI